MVSLYVKGKENGHVQALPALGNEAIPLYRKETFFQVSEEQWQLARTIVAVGAKYRSNWRKKSWQLPRNAGGP